MIDRGEISKELFVLDKNFAFSLASNMPVLNTLSSAITGFFDDGDVAIQISKDKWLKSTGAHVVIVINIQKAELISLRDKLDIPNGFANCFLWIPTDSQGCFSLPEPMPEEDIDHFRQKIALSIEKANAYSFPVTMSDPAKKLWDKAYRGLTTEYSGFAGSVVDRNEVHALRLALIYALAAGRREIRIKDLKAAIAVVNYSCESALLLFNGAHQDKRKEKLLQALRTAPNQEMSLTDISESVFKHNLASREINKIIKELESAKLVVVIVLDGEVAGRRPTMVKLAAAEHHQN